MIGEEKKQGGWWTSLPGILAQLAALIIAVSGLLALLGPKVGLFKEEVTTVQRITPTESWHDTGLWFAQGDTVSITADGSWTLSDEGHGKYPSTSADGWTWPDLQAHDPAASQHSFPNPKAAPGALLGRIGTDGEVFLVGKHIERHRALAGGKLYLGINDTRFDDNAGSIEVSIEQLKQKG
jgi:hypothetical protein